MRKIREVLVNEYIGAIAIGFLLAQALAATVSTIVQSLAFYMENRNRGVMGGGRGAFDWSALLLPAVSVILDLLVAFLLLFWLYWGSDAKTAPEPEETERAEPQA